MMNNSFQSPMLTPIQFVKHDKNSLDSNIPVMMMKGSVVSRTKLTGVNQDLMSVQRMENNHSFVSTEEV